MQLWSSVHLVSKEKKSRIEQIFMKAYLVLIKHQFPFAQYSSTESNIINHESFGIKENSRPFTFGSQILF